ncbi:RICIN domain-containing protein [Stigmatella hybrida]
MLHGAVVQIQQYDWLNNDCQKWHINPVSNGYYNIINKLP